MLIEFNEIYEAELKHIINKQQNPTKFENGLNDPTLIGCEINTKNQWNIVITNDPTFNYFYNKLSKYVTKSKIIINEPSQTSIISKINTGRGGCSYSHWFALYYSYWINFYATWFCINFNEHNLFVSRYFFWNIIYL